MSAALRLSFSKRTTIQYSTLNYPLPFGRSTCKRFDHEQHNHSNLHFCASVYFFRAKKRKVQTMKKQKDPNLFDVDRYKCWMFPSHRSDARNAETVAKEKELRRMVYEAKYPKSNAKEVEL
jgi:hypothetical protein